jgi:hypothetical protein
MGVATRLGLAWIIKKYGVQFDIKRGASLKLTDNLISLLRKADPEISEPDIS